MDTVRLLRWYRRNRRDLPWRQTKDPYKIWVSEVLLQQTRVDQAIPYYERFLTRFSTVQALAEAPLDAVLKAWEGAGYYARARNLQKAAKFALLKWGGLPKTYDDWLLLPGVGPYIAAAVSSIAFGESNAVLDGNVIRVASRLLAEQGDSSKPATRKKLQAFVQRHLPPAHAGNYNQGLMELGATVCLPKKPLCGKCPLQKDCRAFQLEMQESFPVKKPKTKIPHFDIACAVVRKNKKILICQRKPDGLLGGLWEFPGGKVEQGESLAEAAVRETREETGVMIRIAKKTPFAVVRHAYSHFRITLHAFEATFVSGNAQPLGCAKTRWVWPAGLEKHAFPKANKALLALT
ncbi:MAG: A/G-specific adenine glycosylase [Candidatus Micrarchaeota archaeon]|nr:A/G-specific adenine glycosylase [Candidatus Micrarchaeota archaeon]